MDVIQKAIVRYKDKYNITIREVKKDEGRVIIEISQDKTLDNKYLSAKELREIAKSLFVSVHDNFHIGAIEYVPLAHDKVDSMKIKTLANTLGIRKSIIADHHSGKKRMTNEEQAMYYYFFKSM